MDFELKVPDTVPINEVWLERFVNFALSKGLSSEDIQSLMDMHFIATGLLSPESLVQDKSRFVSFVGTTALRMPQPQPPPPLTTVFGVGQQR